MWCANPSGSIRLFAVTRYPDSGSVTSGISSYGTQPSHSSSSLQPQRGRSGERPGAIGTRPTAL